MVRERVRESKEVLTLSSNLTLTFNALTFRT
jgi:hypothetical protein